METVRDILAPALKAESLGEEIFKNAVEASQTVNFDFSISVFRNLGGEAIRFFAGEPREVFHESLNFADSIYKVSVDGEADIVLVSPGGSPFDANIVRACGCLENAVKIVGRNGVIILVAECSDGYGDLDFQRVIRERGGDLNMLEKALVDRFSVSGFIAYRFLKAFKKASVVMVSAAPECYASEIPGLRIFRTVNEALDYALKKVGGGAKVSAILNGSLIIPVARRN
jgi:nickel-dependent lactate racemase